ncbi:hypothetical protein CFC21_089889 [Triticum aestivum]|uniref:Serine-rich protein-like protein n=2 Tax=Triticum aestivum TaxID=4565 RepID=A0A9R1LDI2_WHEAT|nr:mineralocorticoid receptor-like [Triticum dicoccoides]XP_044409968.1 mineralocorticoid receptor-like [Triticum aestivum]KAF7086604.1 hypothetical protein CFC21_089889 [Triticum aestivum]
MSTAAASRPSGPVLLSPFPNYQSASLSRVKLSAAGSPVKSVSVSSPPSSPTAKVRRSCMCSPTNHPGSFRCSLHKEGKQAAPAVSSRPASPPSPPSKRTASPFAQLVPSGSGSGCSKRSYSGLAQRVPMGSGHWARKALVPSPAVQQQQHRKRVVERFHAGPSRLSAAGGRQ